MGTQRRTNVRVRAGHTHGDPGPVANMAPGRREHLERNPLDPLANGGQIADHSRWLVGQSQLYRPIQILDDVAETATHPQDYYLSYGTCPDPGPGSRGGETS